MLRTAIRRGPLLMTLAAASFTVMMALFKVVRTELGPWDVLFWRGVTSTPLALLMCWHVGLRVRRVGLVFVRALFGTATVVLLAYSARGVAVADMNLLFRLHPLLVAILAPIALGHKERAGRLVWFLLLLSMIGVGLILAPSLAVGSRYGLAAVFAGACAACAHVTVRALMRTDDPRIVVFYSQAISMLVAFLALYVTEGRVPMLPSSGLVLPVLGVGVTATLGQLFMTFAYRADRAALVAAASYSGVLFGVLVDIVYFALVPGANVWVGGAIIVAAGICLVFASSEPEAPVSPDSDDQPAPSSEP